jgi:hypothetical protein
VVRHIVIRGELLKHGIVISERSVSRFMPKKTGKPPSQTWRTFLDNHLGSLASIDFFTTHRSRQQQPRRTKTLSGRPDGDLARDRRGQLTRAPGSGQYSP